MKHKLILVAVIIMFTSYFTFSQNCNLAIKEGSKLTLTAYSWANPNLYDAKFQKLKDNKKDEQIISYNQDVSTGKLAPSSTYPMTYTIKKKSPAAGGDEYTLTTTIAGKEYSSYVTCKNDTLYSYRNKGIVDLSDGKGGSLGFTIQGPAVLPMNMKVGDIPPHYDDMTVLYPTISEEKAKYVDYVKTFSGEVVGLYMFSLKAVESLAISAQTIHYMNALVTAEDEITFGGTKYKSFVIESQTWTKGKMDISVKTAYRDVNEAYEKGIEIMKSKTEKMMIKKGITNELGYTVSYLKEWYVPQIGIVKSETYDNLGGIAGGMSVTALE